MDYNKLLFPAKNPTKVEVYGRFCSDLVGSIKKQVFESYKKETAPDGFILLIDSTGGSKKSLTTIMNGFKKLNMPMMGFVEDEALSCGAELLLMCEYRVATPHAKVQFHWGSMNIDGVNIMNPETLSVLVRNFTLEEEAAMERFSKITGQTMEKTRAIYRTDTQIYAPYAKELGIIHEIVDDMFPARPDFFKNKE